MSLLFDHLMSLYDAIIAQPYASPSNVFAKKCRHNTCVAILINDNFIILRVDKVLVVSSMKLELELVKISRYELATSWLQIHSL
jgi:hypothetical protein